MKQFTIYLAGAMSCFGKERYDEGTEWREEIKGLLFNTSLMYRVVVIDPNNYYNFLEDDTYDSQREIMDFDLYKVRHSDILVVNYNDDNNNSKGTDKEVACAYEHGIPVIGLNERGIELHPWQECQTNKMFSDTKSLCEYLEEFYLN